ncbi:MAG: YihA family ribosome biogenesis GTP-binding protein, partial [Actinomycetota bacterium]
GRTQLINVFTTPSGATLVDLPGYGYAKASKATRATWPRMIEGYLLGREELVRVVVLVDGAIGPTPLDVQMLDWLRYNDLPHSVIATKADKVKSSKRARRKRELAEGCDLDPGDVLWVSTSTGAGIDQLRSLVDMWLRDE